MIILFYNGQFDVMFQTNNMFLKQSVNNFPRKIVINLYPNKKCKDKSEKRCTLFKINVSISCDIRKTSVIVTVNFSRTHYSYYVY